MGERAIGILPVFLTLAGLQLVLTLVLSALLAAFYRLYRHAYLRDWALSWLALAAYLALAALGGGTSGGGPAAALRLLAHALSLVAGYLQVAWLLLGAFGLARGSDVPAGARRGALAAACLVPLASLALVLPWASGLAGRLSPIMLRCLVAGVAYLAASGYILSRRFSRTRPGAAFASLALVLYACDQLAYFALGFLHHARQLEALVYLGAFDLLATAVIGLALVAFSLEGERERQRELAELARRRERAQACAYRVSEAARGAGDLLALFRTLHESLGEVLPARNFYIALHDAQSGTLSFPYFADERDAAPAAKPLGSGLTEYVLRTRKPLLADPERFRELRAQGEVELIASDSVDWLGAPLVVRDEVIGVAAVQTYDRRVRLKPEDLDLFVFVCGQIAAAIEARRAEEALRRAAKEESLGVLAGGVAHDFNNLLAAILGHSARALQQLPEGHPARAHVQKAAGVVERASDLSRQMLAYTGQGRFEVRPVDLNALVRENLPLLEVTLPKGVRLEARLADQLPAVDADVGQLQQVLMNLVINAGEAIGERAGRVAVATGVRQLPPGDAPTWRTGGAPLAPGRYVALTIADDGAGMDAATLERIFDPFFSTKLSGRGLGLATVFGVVRGHGGALRVESAPGRGTRFELLFAPGSTHAPPPEPSHAAAPEPSQGGARRRAATILLVDDERAVREMVGEILAGEGFRVLVAEDGPSAVALYRERRSEIDVVLLDLTMPGQRGDETLRQLRALDPGVRAIISSGNSQAQAELAAAGRPVAFLQKPYRPERLLAVIDSCLEPRPLA